MTTPRRRSQTRGVGCLFPALGQAWGWGRLRGQFNATKAIFCGIVGGSLLNHPNLTARPQIEGAALGQKGAAGAVVSVRRRKAV